MARIGYVSRDTMPEGRTDLYDRLAAERGTNLEHIFLALANAPDLAEAVLGLATALRKKTTLSRVFRELAVVTVGLETDAQYEVEHHWRLPPSTWKAKKSPSSMPKDFLCCWRHLHSSRRAALGRVG